MKKRYFVIIAVLVLALALGGALFLKPAPADYASVYITALDSWFTIDPGLHAGMKYLAIDMDTLKYADDEDKRLIAEHYEQKFNIEVKDASFDDLEKQGLVINAESIDGILLSVDKVKANHFFITVEGEKFRSGDGANGIKSVLKRSGDTWKLKSSEMIWIS